MSTACDDIHRYTVLAECSIAKGKSFGVFSNKYLRKYCEYLLTIPDISGPKTDFFRDMEFLHTDMLKEYI